MSKIIAFLFPGQGFQSVGMGRPFWEAFQRAKQVFEQGDEILKRPLSKIIFEGPEEALTQTENSQPAIYLTSLAILSVLQEQSPALKPAICAGLSLGEYSALSASQRLSFEEGLPLVQFRADAMQRACCATSGAMAALLGLSAEEVREMVQSLNLPDDLWVANYNTPGQTVISGTSRGVEKGCEAAKALGAKRAIPLKVAGAFHSGLMKSAEEELQERIREVPFTDSPIQLVMNVTGDFEDDLEQIRQLLVRQVTSSVCWEQSIRRVMPAVDLFVEIGCGKGLAAMNKKIGVEVPTVSINTPSDLEVLSSHL